MFKKVMIVVLQMILLFAGYIAGAILAALNKLPMWTMVYSNGQSLFVWDGVVLLLVVFVLLLLVHALRRTLRSSGALPVLALVLSLLLLAAMKFPLSRLTPTGPVLF
ncbi:MAG: hypothetical protein PW735_06490 [Acidobacteriaceae bacterium]|nr:hypothetical protein [Acidobacteriaceae bacterium]